MSKILFYWATTPEYTLGFYSSFDLARMAIERYESEFNSEVIDSSANWELKKVEKVQSCWWWRDNAIIAIAKLDETLFYGR